MNAYVMKGDDIQVVECACWLEVHPDDIVLIRSDDPERRPLAAVKLSDWAALVGIGGVLAVLLAIAIALQLLTAPPRPHHAIPSGPTDERVGPAV